MRARLLGPAALAAGFVAAACSEAPVAAPEAGEVALNANIAQTTVTECQTMDFEEYIHGDAITSQSLTFTPGVFTTSVSQIRYGPTPGGDVTAYDTNLQSGGVPDLDDLDNTHDDTLEQRLCVDCGTFSVDKMAVVSDPNFAAGGDNTQGGQMIFTITGGGSLGTYTIEDFLAVDDDLPPGAIRLFVDGVFADIGGVGGNASVEVVDPEPDPVWTATAIFEWGRNTGEFGWTDPPVNGSGGVDQIQVCLEYEVLVGGEGCTPGYWKNHAGIYSQGRGGQKKPSSWQVYHPTHSFDATFGVTSSFGGNLIDALKRGGGGEKALGRHAVAALLNAAHSGVSYDLFPADVIAVVQDAYTPGGLYDFESAKNYLAAFNEQVCPL